MFTLLEDYKKDHRIGKFVETDGKTYEIEVYYSLGGMNYFTGSGEGRGYYLSVTPVQRTKNCRTFTAFSGTKVLVRDANRFSQKALDQVASEYMKDINTNPMVQKIFQHVLSKGQ